MDSGNQQAMLSLLRGALISLGTILGAHGLIGPHDKITPANWEFIVGFLMALAPIAWGYVDKLRVAKTIKEKQAIAVQAGINLVTAGAAILVPDGMGGQAPKPVTVASADAIVKDFGPTTPPGTST